MGAGTVIDSKVVISSSKTLVRQLIGIGHFLFLFLMATDERRPENGVASGRGVLRLSPTGHVQSGKEAHGFPG